MVKSKETSTQRRMRLKEGKELLKQKVKLEKAQLATQKFKEKKRPSKLSKLLKGISKRIPSKKILKTQQPTITIKQKEPTSILGDPNRFFKEELEEVKRTMFFK